MKLEIKKNKEVLVNIDYYIDQYNKKTKFKKITISGPLGSISFKVPTYLSFIVNSDSISVNTNYSFLLSDWNTFISMLKTSIKGVTTGYEMSLTLTGVGYKASIQNNTLSLSIGFSHPVNIDIPSYINFIDCPNPTTIVAKSYSYPLLSNFFNSIRLIKPSSKDRYKGKGLSITTK